MARSIVDFYVVQPSVRSGDPEPTLRDLVYKYYAAHFDEPKAVELAREYMRQIDAELSKVAP